MIQLGLTPDQLAKVEEGARLYRATYIDTIDNIFKIAEGLEILHGLKYGSGVQGSYAMALIQCGYTARDGISPIDESIRSNLRELRKNETDVRKWWDTVPAKKKRDWVSARAIYRHWKRHTRPDQPSAKKRGGGDEQSRLQLSFDYIADHLTKQDADYQASFHEQLASFLPERFSDEHLPPIGKESEIADMADYIEANVTPDQALQIGELLVRRISQAIGQPVAPKRKRASAKPKRKTKAQVTA
jgi:hypothetical protein